MVVASLTPRTASGGLQVIHNDVVMVAGFEIVEHFFNGAVGVDQKADAVNAVIGFTYKGFLAPDAELLADLMVFIREQGKVQQLFSAKRDSFSGLSVLMPSTSTPAFSARPYYRAGRTPARCSRASSL